MKTTFNKVLQAAVAATVLTFAGASHADVYTYEPQADMGGQISPDSATTGFFKYIKPIDFGFGNVTQIGVSVYEMVNSTNNSQKYYAYCIQPAVDIQQNALYTANYNYSPDDKVRKLYESSYSSTAGDQDRQVAFQLALWELQKDDGNLSTGIQHFAANQDPQIDVAAQMLLDASTYQLTSNHFNYVSFTGSINGQESQELLGVSAVPEADTWAMMALGLGMLGLVGRRQQKNEKFA